MLFCTIRQEILQDTPLFKTQTSQEFLDINGILTGPGSKCPKGDTVYTDNAKSRGYPSDIAAQILVLPRYSRSWQIRSNGTHYQYPHLSELEPISLHI
jgi:hypothetical protein